MFERFVEWLRKFFAQRNIDFIGNIKDTQYYRLGNKTEVSIELDVKDSKGVSGLPGKFKLQPKEKEIFSGMALNAIGKEEILEQVYHEKISFQSLDIEINTEYRVSNRTGRRIGIGNYKEGYGELIIPPFGTRTINSEFLKWYNFLEWQRQDLVRIERDNLAYNGAAGFSKLWDWVKLLPGIVLVGLVGFGIPLWIVYYFGGGGDLLTSFTSGDMFVDNSAKLLQGLGRLFQVGFICIAAILPALFYYLFGRQQVEKLREKFFHDILVLDPHLYTLSEAEAKYDTLLSSAFGSGSSNSPFAILLLIFSTALLVAGWTITLAPYNIPAIPITELETVKSLADFFKINPSPLSLGFLGVYFFSINMIFRRYVRADLTPKTYAYITVRLLVALVLVYSVSALPEFSTEPLKTGLLPLAFIIGVFPEEGFRMIRDSARKIIPGLKSGRDEKYPLTDLEGMNQYDQARLLEEGIENIENLAHHNLIDLLAFTRIPTARLVDMVDQAILYIHLGIFDQEEIENQETNDGQVSGSQTRTTNSSGRELLQYLKSIGVRTATDLIEVLKDKDTAKTIAEDSHLRTIRTTFKDDEWLAFIMNWRKESSKEAAIRPSFVKDPYKFYETGEEETLIMERKDVRTSEKIGSDLTNSVAVSL